MAANNTVMRCNTCSGQVDLNHKFCTQCASEINREEMLIKHYFFKGYEYKTAIGFLAKYHEVKISLWTLKNRISSYGLARNNAQIDLQAVKLRIQQKLEGSGCMVGYRSMWHTLRLEGYVVPRSVVQAMLKEINPEGCREIQAKRFKRRIYSVPGPNFYWQMEIGRASCRERV